MNFSEIKLPEFVLAEMYNDVLIDTNEQEIKFLGENKKEIAIIVSNSNAVFLDDASFDFLSKILQACKLSIADTAIINTHNHNYSYKDIKNKIACKYMLLFGVHETTFELPLVFDIHKIKSYDNCKLLNALTMSKYIEDNSETQANKRNLWTALKEMFELV